MEDKLISLLLPYNPWFLSELSQVAKIKVQNNKQKVM